MLVDEKNIIIEVDRVHINLDGLQETEKQAVNKILQNAKTNNKLLKITINREVRSLQQNAYLHAILSRFALHTGTETIDDVKASLLIEASRSGKWKGKEFVQYGQRFFYTAHTSTATTKEISELIDFIRDYLMRVWDFYTPTPEEYYKGVWR